jgi:hypothetical protein
MREHIYYVCRMLLCMLAKRWFITVLFEMIVQQLKI